MDIKKTFGVDKTKETEGVWKKLGGEAEVLVARKGNPHYSKILQRLMKPYRQMIRTMPDDLAEDIMIDAMIQGILLGWKGIKEDGKDIEYNKSNAKRLLKEYPEFRSAIDQLSTELEDFKLEETKAIEQD